MKKIILFFMVAMMSLSQAVWAIPAYPVKKTITLQDGSKVEVTLTGDERLSFYLAKDGRAFRQMQNNRFELIPQEELVNMKAAAKSAAVSDNARRSRRAQRRLNEFVSDLKGTKKGLVILVNFADNAFLPNHDKKYFERYFNEKGFSDDGFMGSVADYFTAQSYGQFTINFDVAGPYTLSRKMSYYGGHYGEAHDAAPQEMAWESMQLANPDVNYKDYDWNGDGEVEQVFIIYAGYGEADGGEENTIWPHESTVSHIATMMDGVSFNSYGCSCELQQGRGTVPAGIGNAAHEFSHCLGYPDAYDKDYSGGYGMAYWDLMSRGSYLGKDGISSICPAGYTSYERWMAGWLEPKELTAETQITNMKPLTQAPEAYVVYNDKNRNEFYLLENRQQDGFDQFQYGHGLLVVHIDYDKASWLSNTPNDDPQHQRMNVIPADGNFTQTSTGFAGDPYPGTTGNTSLTDTSSPAATLFNINRDGRKMMGKPIEGITENADGTISFIFNLPKLVAPAPNAKILSDNSFEASWNAVDRAVSYELNLSEFPLKQSPAEACIFTETFAKCVTKSTGFSDIGSKMVDYTDNKGFSGTKLYTSPDGLKMGAAKSVGTLQTSWFKAPSTGELTYVLGVKPGTAGATVNVGAKLVKNNIGPYDEMSFSFDQAGYVILHTNKNIDDYSYLLLNPDAIMYINYLAVYDGNFTASELGLTTVNKVAAKVAPRKIKTLNYTTTATSQVFTDLNPACRYELTIRCKDSYQRISEWSEVLNVMLNTTAISEVQDDSVPTGKMFDLQGREVKATSARGLYIMDGKKYLKK